MKSFVVIFFAFCSSLILFLGCGESGGEGRLGVYADELTLNLQKFESAKEGEGYYKKEQTADYYKNERIKLEQEAELVKNQLETNEEFIKKEGEQITKQEAEYVKLLKKRQAQIEFLKSELNFLRDLTTGELKGSVVRANRDNAARVLDQEGSFSAYTKRIVQESERLLQNQIQSVPVPKVSEQVSSKPTNEELANYATGVQTKINNISSSLSYEQKLYKDNKDSWNYSQREESLQKQLDFITQKEKLFLQADSELSKGLNNPETNSVAAAKATEFSGQALSAAKERVKVIQNQIKSEGQNIKRLVQGAEQRVPITPEEAQSNNTFLEGKLAANLPPDVDTLVQNTKILTEQMNQAQITLANVGKKLNTIKKTQLDATSREGFNNQVKRTLTIDDYKQMAQDLSAMKKELQDATQGVRDAINKVDGVNERFFDPSGLYKSLTEKLKAKYSGMFGKGNDKKVYQQLFTKDVAKTMNNRGDFSRNYADSAKMTEKDFKQEVIRKPSLLDSALKEFMYRWKQYIKKETDKKYRKMFNQADNSWSMLKNPVKRETYNNYLDGTANKLAFTDKATFDRNNQIKTSLQTQESRLATSSNVFDTQVVVANTLSQQSITLRNAITN